MAWSGGLEISTETETYKSSRMMLLIIEEEEQQQ